MTRAAIAAADRKNKKDIADKDRALQEKVARKNYELNKLRNDFQNIKDAASATKDVVGAFGNARGIFNHPEWYKKFNASQFANQLPNFARVGLETIKGFLGVTDDSELTALDANRVLPGICTIIYHSVLPQQGFGNGYIYSPVNVGLSRFMSELRKMNSRIGDYDASDFGLYWYASIDFLWLILRLKTGIAAYNTYHIDNAYYAKAVLSALGFDPDDFFAHIAQYKYECQKYIQIFNSSVLIPSNLTFALRRIWLATAVIRDHKGSNSQLYMFRQQFLGVLSSEENSVQFGSTEFDNWGYTVVINKLEEMKTALIDSVGMQTMMADLRAGIPDSKFLKIPDLNESDVLEPMEGDFDLEQIHNLVTLPGFIDQNGDYHIAMSSSRARNIHAMANGYLAQGEPNSGRTALVNEGPLFSYSANVLRAYKDFQSAAHDAEFLNFYDENSDGDDILEATRLRSVSTVNSSEDAIYQVTRGTELVTHCLIYTYAINHTGNIVLDYLYMNTTILYEIGSAYVAPYFANIYSKFDWMPKIRWAECAFEDDAFVFNLYTTQGEIDKVVPLANANLAQLHTECTLSEFYIDSSEFLRAK